MGKWDGLERVEINLFLYTENPQMKEEFKTKFMDHFKNLGMAFEDTFPRGYGDVVNFKSDMETYVPHWTSKNLARDILAEILRKKSIMICPVTKTMTILIVWKWK